MSEENKLEFAVIKYLQKYPDFFAKHPELLTELEVATSKGELTNLTTHQLRSLQKENRKLKSQMSQLISNAQQSESLMNRLLNMLTELSLANEAEFLSGFVGCVRTNFPSDFFKLLLADELVDYSLLSDVEKMTAVHKNHFSVFSVKSEPVSGRLQQEKLQSIFDQANEIKSAIVLPIGGQAEFGLMCFASKDEEKFHPHSSSDILQKLSDILAKYFNQQKPEGEHQVMQ